MTQPRILIAGLFHETNTFVDRPTPGDDFILSGGRALRERRGDSSPLGGALEATESLGWAVLPAIDARAMPSGILDDALVEVVWRVLRASIDAAGTVDGIFLVLHGAMTAKSFDDVEGELLERIRSINVLKNIPIFGVLDLHANATERMATNADCLVAYRENPHTDARQTASRAVRLMDHCLRTGVRPRTYWRRAGILWPPTGTGTADEPMRSLERLAREIEARSPDVWCVNVLAGFSFADVPDAGVSFSVVSSGSADEAERALDELCALAWSLRETGNVVGRSAEEVLADFAAAGELDGHSPPIVIAEPADNIGGGAPGDGTGLLRALLQLNVMNAAVAICDPDAVKQAKPGERITLDLGGRGSRLDAGPVRLAVEVLSTSDGQFELEDKHSHLASVCGDRFDMGPCAIVRHGGITILLTSRPTPPMDLGQWRSQGINPAKLSLIGVKAAVAHRRAYEPIARKMLSVETAGPCTSRLETLPYRQVKRPVYPLDE